MLERPDPTEHAEYYATYIQQVPDGDIIRILTTQIKETATILAAVPPDRETYRYAPDKWSIREVVGHIIDTERVFAARALWFARQAEGPLPSMDQDQWVANSNAGDRPLAVLVTEFRTVRAATLALFTGLDPATELRRGVASGFEFSVRAMAWIIAGHERHHRAGLRRDYGV